MPENKHLNEQIYQGQKKKLNIVAIAIAIVAVVSGLSLIIVPRILNLNNVETGSTAVVAEPAKQPVLTNTELNAKESAIRAEYTKKMTDDGWFEEQKEMSGRISDMRLANADASRANFSAEADASMAAAEAEGAANMAAAKANGSISMMTMAGATVMMFGLFISGLLFYYANFRKIAAFGVQTVMPVAKETITEMAPTIGAAYGSMVEAAAPGVSRGASTMIDGTTPAVGRATDTILKSAAPGIGEITREIKEGISEEPHKKHKK